MGSRLADAKRKKEETEYSVIEILAALIALPATGALIQTLIRSLTSLIERQRDQGLIDARDISLSLYLVCVNTGAVRVTILRAQNGGDEIAKTFSNGGFITSTVVLQANNGVLPVENWTNVPVRDEGYKELLRKVESEGFFEAQVTDFEEGSDIRNLYERDGITHSKVYRLFQVKKTRALFYVSISLTDEAEVTSQHLDYIRSTLTEIRQILASSRDLQQIETTIQ